MNHTACFEGFGPRCTFPQYVAPNDAIAGFGVLISFVILSALCILGTILSFIRRGIILRDQDREWPPEIDERRLVTTFSLITILFGDIFLVASIAISLSALILQGTDSIIVYHYNIVCNLAIAATFASLATTFALPLFTADRWTSGVRIFFYTLSVGLLAALLILRVHAGGSYPGGVPSNSATKTSAMVLQASCFLNQPVPTNCTFSTDRRPLPGLSDAWALLPLAFIVFAAIGAQCPPMKVAKDMPPENLKNQKWHFYEERLVWEFLVILISIIWTSVALQQAFSLRRWMNSSGWFEDPAELVVDSFSQLVPIFQILTLLIIIAAAFDAKHQRGKEGKANAD